MATSAFKSTTRRIPVASSPAASEDSSSASSSKAHRRSRSLSRFSHRLPPEDEPAAHAPRGKFVNTVRGSGFPEISLDDLALELFSLKDEDSNNCDRDRPSRRSSDVGRWASETASSKRRGRSVSRQSSRSGDDGKSAVSGGSASRTGVSEANLRRRRSVSAVRRLVSDYEMPTASNNRRLERSLSQKDFSQLHDGYSSHSSAITDDEMKDTHSGKYGAEKTIRAVYAQKKADGPSEDVLNSEMYKVMRKELRHAMEQIRTDLEQAMERKDAKDQLQYRKSGVLEASSAVKNNYTTKLELSEKRKQNLLSEIVSEEQGCRDSSGIIRGLHDSMTSVAEKPARARKRSNDRSRMSKCLNEEAEKYFEDFLSNVEDTDISSFDGERSDGSSTLGGVGKLRDATCREVDMYQSPAGSSLPVEMDGVILPWLQWETSHDGSVKGNNRTKTPAPPKTLLWDAGQDQSSHSSSSRGSWSPGVLSGQSINDKADGAGRSVEVNVGRESRFDMDEYLKLKRDEDLLFDRYREQHRISSGGLLLCTHIL